MPILVTALSQQRTLLRKRKRPEFEMGREFRFSFPRYAARAAAREGRMVSRVLVALQLNTGKLENIPALR